MMDCWLNHWRIRTYIYVPHITWFINLKSYLLLIQYLYHRFYGHIFISQQQIKTKLYVTLLINHRVNIQIKAFWQKKILINYLLWMNKLNQWIIRTTQFLKCPSFNFNEVFRYKNFYQYVSVWECLMEFW